MSDGSGSIATLGSIRGMPNLLDDVHQILTRPCPQFVDPKSMRPAHRINHEIAKRISEADACESLRHHTVGDPIAGGLAAIAGTFVAAGTAGMEQTSWIIALKALPAIIIGGLDSIPGAVIGGLAVGLVESLTAIYQPDVAPWLGRNFSLVAPYALMLVVLLVRPYGLFGTKEVERV